MTDRQLLNINIEISLRLLILLNELEDSVDIQRIIYYDYALIHSGDFENAPDSIYPPSPFRKEELFIKNSIIKDSLKLLCQKQLISVDFKNEGIFYKKNELSELFLKHLKSEYVNILKNRAKWVNEYLKKYNDTELKEFFNVNIGQWKSEFSTYGLTKRELVKNG